MVSSAPGAKAVTILPTSSPVTHAAAKAQASDTAMATMKAPSEAVRQSRRVASVVPRKRMPTPAPSTTKAGTIRMSGTTAWERPKACSSPLAISAPTSTPPGMRAFCASRLPAKLASSSTARSGSGDSTGAATGAGPLAPPRICVSSATSRNSRMACANATRRMSASLACAMAITAERAPGTEA